MENMAHTSLYVQNDWRMLLKLSFKLDWVHSCDILGLRKQQVTVLVEYKVEFSVFDEKLKMALVN